MDAPARLLLVLLAAGTAPQDPEVRAVPDPEAALRVLPAEAFRASGPQGGPFRPETRLYLVRNGSEEERRWSAEASVPWIAVEPARGPVAPGEGLRIRVSIVQEEAGRLVAGEHDAFVRFVEEGSDRATFRQVRIRVDGGSGLLVDPAAGFEGAASDGRRSCVYTLENRGRRDLRWRAESEADWLDVAPRAGILSPGGSAAVWASIRPDAAPAEEGRHAAAIRFVNETDGAGSTTRVVGWSAGEPRGLVVEPAGDVLWPRAAEGEEAPGSSFLLRNTGEEPLRWEARLVGAWLRIDEASGELAPGAARRVRVEAMPGRVPGPRQDARDEGAGGAGARTVRPGAVVFVDGSAGATTTRRIALAPRDAAEPAAREVRRTAVVSRFGITWTLDRDVEAGRFANGDFWVVGPVAVVGIDPPSAEIGDRVLHGSMVNPSPRTWAQGYDSAMYGKYRAEGSYRAELNVSLGVSPRKPLVLPCHSSLVSAISLPAPGARPQLRTASVLTVLEEPPPPGSFRPPYCGRDKTPRFRAERLDLSRLARLEPVPSTPSIRRAEAWFQRPWLDHVPNWTSQYFHPSANMPNYGREIADRVGIASLLLNLDLPDERKEPLLVGFVQVGIDLFGVVEAGGKTAWAPRGGGHKSGRKWPILFAGLVLGDRAMAGIGADDEVAFAEDDQTFHVEETSPGVYNHGHGGYGPEHVGLAEWGGEHATRPESDTVDWFENPYRTCCTANSWWGQVLAALVMDARELWNHEPLFDYMDRYRAVAPTTGQPDWTISWSEFQLRMWDTYRARY